MNPSGDGGTGGGPQDGSASDGPPTLPPGVEAERTESGLEILDIAVGDGEEAGLDRAVRIRYRVWLTDGSFVEASGDDGAEFVPGSGSVIEAFEEGVIGMKVGGKRRLIVPSDLAYGPQGRGTTIPPYATLITDLELLAVG
ncbi:MAG: FKBP-type peptidyl-prolyl cis-trans isomerase [Gemmatimonadetes bacterium]|nr:FKBP-type peptidyl-prolyl cis-trans isomerase [Gemmatimonadota bacterium]